MAMRGFLFSSDIAMFTAILAISAVFVAHLVSTTVDVVSNQNKVYQIRTSAEHAINILLFAAKPEIRCTYGKNNIPVPACAWANGVVDSRWFWVDKRFKCYVTATDEIASKWVGSSLGCKYNPPERADTIVVIPFRLCWAGDVTGKSVTEKQDAIKKCKWIEANIWVWT